ncbi:MAG: CPBP family intramembrane glutamic endopeptidase [Phycisphaerae bacterium]
MASRRSKDRFRSTRKPRKKPDTYFEHTQQPLQSLLLVAPLLVLFHVGVLAWGIHDYPEYPMRVFLQYFGVTTSFLPPLLVVGVLLAQHLARRDPWTARPWTLLGMLGESVAWTLPLLAVQYLRDLAISADLASTLPAARGLGKQIVFYMGTGVYEEFVFRLVAISLLMLVLVDLLALPETAAAITAVVVSAVLFALAHFGIPGVWEGASFSWPRFLFLAPAGVLWGGLYAFRGFGIAVGSHVTWNVLHLLLS